jgi:hypothetical protein
VVYGAGVQCDSNTGSEVACIKGSPRRRGLFLVEVISKKDENTRRCYKPSKRAASI